jgi:hypothetical protein
VSGFRNLIMEIVDYLDDIVITGETNLEVQLTLAFILYAIFNKPLFMSQTKMLV